MHELIFIFVYVDDVLFLHALDDMQRLVDVLDMFFEISGSKRERKKGKGKHGGRVVLSSVCFQVKRQQISKSIHFCR